MTLTRKLEINADSTSLLPSNRMERFPRPTPAWALSFPEPRSHPASMSPDALHELVTTKAPVVDFIVVDVRRTDVDVRSISKIHSVVRVSYLPSSDRTRP
jgi:hypothetical protein